MPEHTPGPWGMEREIRLGRLGEDNDRNVTEFQRDGYTIGYWYDCEWDGRCPNTTLIAASPMLLENCVELLRVIDALREINVLGDWPVVRDAMHAVRCSVAQAKGDAT